jgi:hypothetical protein
MSGLHLGVALDDPQRELAHEIKVIPADATRP